MLIRGQTTEDRIGEIAAKFSQGLQGFAQSQRQEAADLTAERAYRDSIALKKQENEQRAIERQRALNLDAQKAQMFEMDSKIKNAKLQELGLPFEQTRDYKKATKVAEIRNQSAESMYYAKQEADAKKKMQAAVIPDFSIANPAVMPTTKDAEEVKSFNEANKNYQMVGKGLAVKLSGLKPLDRTGQTNAWKSIEQDLTQMALQAKELARLGVLNGPDLDLVNKDMGSISLQSINTIGVKGAIDRLNSTLARANEKLMNKASSRGYKFNQEQAPEELTKEAKMQRLIELRTRKAGA